MKRVTSLLLLLMFMTSTALIAQVNSVSNVLERSHPQMEKPIMDKAMLSPDEVAEHRMQVQSDATGDIVFSLDVETICGDNQLLGCEYDGTYLWITGGGNAVDPNFLYKVDPIAGTLVSSYQQPATATGWGIRDLVWVEDDGMIYGGNETNFYSFEPATETWTTLFASSFGTIRGLAYDGTHFWTKSFGDPLYEFDIAGNVINSYTPAVAAATYGAAFDWSQNYLYLFSQDDAVFYQFDLAGNHTGVTYDVSAAQTGGISGGAFFDFGNLSPGLATLGFLLQGTPDMVGAMELYPSVVYANDVGITAITEPNTGYDLTAAESITITMKNWGTADQSNIPYEVTWDPADGVYNGVYAGPLAAGASVDITLPVTADLSAYGDYLFTACTQLASDEFAANDCKEKTVNNSPAPTLLYPQSADYWTGTTDGTTKTQNSLVIGMSGEDGWFMFDVSGIPPGSLITSITFHGYVYETYYPYWSLTPLYLDPLTATAADLKTQIQANSGSTVAYAYNNESSTFAPGWHSYVLEGTANTDLQAALGQGWFAMGMDSRDNSTTYYIKFDGWNETNMPYLEVEWEENTCMVECPVGGIDEGEPCGDDVNGGCNMATPAFTPIMNGDIICGTAWADADTRDTDWYEVTVAGTSTLTFEVTAEFEVVLGMIEQIDPGVPGCDNITGYLDPYYVATACEPGVIEIAVPAGTYYFFVAPTAFNGLPCTVDFNDYTAELTVVTPTLGTITGFTSDAVTLEKLGGVLVEAGLFSTLSNNTAFNKGKYSLAVPVGTYDVTASLDGYHTEVITGFNVVAGANALNIALDPFIAPELLSATPGPGSVTLEWAPIEPAADLALNQYINTSSFVPRKAPGNAKPVEPNPETIRQGGDDIASATVVPAIPYLDNGTTAGYTNDYDEVCPYTGSTAPDVVYSYTPASDIIVDIGLCNSLYDTKMYVYENAATPGAPYACNDDACGNDGYKSQITGLELFAGNTYYIVVDGYGTESGEYELTIDEFVECVLECPVGSIPEGEVCPDDEYVDTYNGGCNSEPPVYQPINCGDVICGTASTYIFTDPVSGDPLNYRDTDWYSITLDEPTLLTWSGMAEFPLLLYVLDDPADCATFTVAQSITAAPCDEAMIEIELAPGTYWLFASLSVFEGYPCGASNDYYVSLTCEPLVVETAFNIYRDGVLYEEGVIGTTFVDESFPSFEDEYCYQVSQIMPDLSESDLSNTLCASPEALPGATCEDPHFITEIPFEGLGFTTEGFGDDYDNTMACGSYYMNGDDFVFSFTPATDIDVSVTLTNTGTWVGVFITEGCPDVGTCVEYATSSSGNPMIESAMLTAGIEYFIIVSTWPSPQFTAFDILIEENINGILYGTVNGPDYDGPVEGVTITADQLRESFTTTTGPDGTYELSLPVGAYDVTAEKEGYIPQTVEGILIEEGVSVEQNFMLEFAPPVLLSAEPSFFDVTLTWDGNPVFANAKSRAVSGITSASNVQENTDALHGPTKIVEHQAGRAVGDDCTDPIIIGALPFTDINTTCGHLNSYEETCLGSYDGGEDIVYQITLTEAMDLEIDMQTTSTWTGMLITDECPIGQNCIDYVTGSSGNKNLLVSLEAGTYFIMIDTWPAPNCIDEFTLTIEEVPECILECPVGAIAEGEECPVDGYVDDYNGGCNADPAVFQPVNCGDVICGTASTYVFESSNRRDTDWYELNIDSPKTLTMTVTAEFPVVMGLIEQFDPGVPGCSNITGSISPAVLANPCEDAIMEVTLIPGTYYLFVGPSVFEGYPCGTDNDYIASFECTDTFVSYYEVYRDDQVDPIAMVYGEMYVDEDVMQGDTYCYEVVQVATPSINLGPSNELCATVPFPPSISVDPLSIYESLPVGGTSMQMLSIMNSAQGTLDFNISVDLGGAKDVSINLPNVNPQESEKAPITGKPVNYEPTDDDPILVLDFAYPENPDFPGQAGVETDGTYIYTTDWQTADQGTFYAYNYSDGTFVGSITVAGLTAVGGGIRDLAYDGTYFYGSYASTNFYQFTLDGATLTGTLIGQWTAPLAIRAVAYNDDNDTFYGNNWSTSITEFDRSGNTISSFAVGTFSSYYGFAYDDMTPGSPYLWGFSQSAGGTDLVLMTLPDGAETGFSYDVNQDIGGVGLLAGGLCLHTSARDGHTLIANVQNEALMGYTFSTNWLTVNPTSGTIEGPGQADLDVSFDATGLEAGIYTADIMVYSNDPVNPSIVVPVQLIVGGMTQNIFMPMGWSGWSAYLNPDARMGMEELMMPVIDDMIITLYFNEIYYPLYGINNMGEFTNAHGYISKMAADATLPLEGFMADPTVNLMEGWNLMPVLQECPIPSDDVFGAIPEVIIAFEVAGNGIYYPLYGVSTLGDLEPGSAYYVKVSADASYTFPGCAKSTSYGYSAPLRPENSTSWNDVNYTGTSHAVIFTENAVSSLMPGDMLGAFNSNGTCVGITQVTGSTASFNMFGDDVTTASADGYVEGEALNFRVYRAETNEQFDLEVVYSSSAPNSNGIFVVNGASVVTDLTMTATSVGTHSLNGLSVYPNPSDGIFNITVNDLDGEITYTVVNAQGQDVYSGSLQESQEIDLSAEPKGIYFIKFMNEKVLRIEKLVIK